MIYEDAITNNLIPSFYTRVGVGNRNREYHYLNNEQIPI